MCNAQARRDIDQQGLEPKPRKAARPAARRILKRSPRTRGIVTILSSDEDEDEQPQDPGPCGPLPKLQKGASSRDTSVWVAETMKHLFVWLKPPQKWVSTVLSRICGWEEWTVEHFVGTHTLLKDACDANDADLVREMLQQLFKLVM